MTEPTVPKDICPHYAAQLQKPGFRHRLVGEPLRDGSSFWIVRADFWCPDCGASWTDEREEWRDSDGKPIAEMVPA